MLEIGNATQNERLDALCKKLDSLAESITDLMDFLKTCLWKALGVGGTFFMVFLGFFIWYVQGL